MSTTKQKFIGTVLIVLSIFFAGLALYFYLQNGNSQLVILENNKKIVLLEESKKPLLDSLEANKKALKESEAIIKSLKETEAMLLKQLKINQNEKIETTTVYFNSDVNKRIELFTELTELTE